MEEDDITLEEVSPRRKVVLYWRQNILWVNLSKVHRPIK
jgi:hypothetical protein